ncbi:uncharacterized protein LOC143038882 [Oratosquilla oratoria]|uniref:uncharacterized protein LOC143038882 n=1 Tax=Oratosquilla oratoria TaxID=337810 RepID=UPI003F76063D
MNGELSESAASSDDLAYAPRDYREPLGLHRTTSEPYYTFDELGIASDVAARLEHLDPRSFQHTQTIMRAGRGRLAPSRVTPYDVPETYSTAPRGRSSSATRAARSVAGAMLNKNASDNDLDHDTSILPIFQKILSERQRTRYPGARDFTMSSCPNITIKCDIVEYL